MGCRQSWEGASQRRARQADGRSRLEPLKPGNGGLGHVGGSRARGAPDPIQPTTKHTRHHHHHHHHRHSHLDRKQDVDRADDIVVLGVHRPRPVDHGVGRRPLLAKVDDGVRRKVADGCPQELKVRDIADQQIDVAARHLAPRPHPLVRGRDGRQRVHAQLDVVRPAREVVDDAHRVPARRQVQGGRPPAVAVPADDHDAAAAAAAAVG